MLFGNIAVVAIYLDGIARVAPTVCYCGIFVVVSAAVSVLSNLVVGAAATVVPSLIDATLMVVLKLLPRPSKSSSADVFGILLAEGYYYASVMLNGT